jgi:hypothetical protein
MKHIKKYEIFNEALKSKKGNSNLISTLCVSMLLINPDFLNNVLDKGLKARYTENSSVFLNDLRNLLFANNRLRLGIYKDNRCVVDEELSKINQEFTEYSSHFDIEKDWNKLLKARKTARNIQEKLLEVEPLTPEMIEYVFWLGPNKDEDNKEDIVLQLRDGRQFPIFTNKKLTVSKTQSFNTFADILIGGNVSRLYSEEYMSKWNKLVQEWIRIMYENANKNIQKQIEKFIDPNRINSISYFDYYDIKHSNREYQHLGEYMEEFDKNILKFSDLMSEIYKNAEDCFENPDEVLNEWEEIKKFILHSKIIEHLYTESFKELSEGDRETDGKYTIAGDDMKMRLLKLFVEMLNVGEKDTYYFGNSGNEFKKLPGRQFFRDMYQKIDVKYDYHVDLTDIDVDDETADFAIRYDLDGEPLAKLNLTNSWSGGEMSGNLNIKMDLDLNKDFNDKVDIDDVYEKVDREEMVDYIINNWSEIKSSQYSFLTKDSLENLTEENIESVYNSIYKEMQIVESLKKTFE